MMDIKNSFKVLILLLSLQFPQLFVCAVLKKSIRNSDLIHYDYTKQQLDPSPRIIGGSEAIARQYPWEVQLRDKRTGWLICGGSLVSDTSILTAGHCVYGKDVEDVMVTLLKKDHDIEDYHMYPDYRNYEDWKNTSDLAILRLKSTLDLALSDMIPIGLPYQTIAKMNLAGENVQLAGWGKTTTGSKAQPSKKLMMVNLEIISNQDCKNEWPYLKE